MANPNAAGAGAAMPTGNVIGSVFSGVELAVGQVADIVNNHTDRLANNPCAWRNTILGEALPRAQQALARAYGLALNLSRAGALAVQSARASAGYAVTGHKFNSTTVQKFGNYLLGQGVPVFPPGAPIAVMAAQPFVRRGPPESTYDVALPGFPGVGMRAGKLAGPQIREYWSQWNAAITLTAEPKGVVRSHRGARGWRAILELLTGMGAPAWASGDSVVHGSYIALLEADIALVHGFLAEATVACREFRSGGGDDSGGGGAAAGLSIAAILALLLGA